MKVSVYIRDSYIKENKTCLIYLRIFLNKKYLNVPLEISVNPDHFDKKKQRLFKGPFKIKYNHIINDAIGRASNIILKYQFNKQTLTRDVFTKEFTNPAVFLDFYAFMDDQIKSRNGEITETSAKQHMSILNKMKKFKKELLIVELDETYLKDFQKYLKNKLKNNPNTIHNALKTVRTYINIAIKLELITKSPFRHFKFRREATYPVFLTEPERNSVMDLYSSNYLPDKYKNVLRWFLFSCFTGLRIGDLRAAKHEDISNKTLYFRPQKTKNINNKRVDVPLTKFALKLICDENPNRIKGLLFDCYSEARMNKNIKEVMAVAKIDKDISFHNARHTFATLFLKKSAKANGILILQRLLGHSNIATTMVYSHVIDDDIRSAMNEFDS